MSIASRLRPLYLRARSTVRGVVVRYPAIDRAVGRRLVALDVMLRRAGLVSVVDRDVRSFRFDGLDFVFDPDNRDLAETVISTGTYETATIEVVRALRPGQVFVDLGANIGFFSVLAARAVGDGGRVHAFEPTPGTAALLRKNLAGNRMAARVAVVEQAVSDHTGMVRFAVYDGAGQPNQIALDDSGRAIEVPATSLDAYFEPMGWPRVDLIKMDIEGAEGAALRGMRGVLERSPDVRLIFEFHLEQLRRAEVPGGALIDAVNRLGFDRFEVLFRERTPIELPRELARLEQMARRANVNVLAWRGPARR